MDTVKTVLIIDDETNVASLISHQLKAKGLQCHMASNGLEGLALLRSLKPNLILLDINMPQMNGFQFLKAVMTPFNKLKYPILVFTTRESTREFFEDLQVEGFLAKPFLMEDLLKEVDRILTQSFKSSVMLVGPRNPQRDEIRARLESEVFEVEVIESKSLPARTGQRLPVCVFVDFAVMNEIQIESFYLGCPHVPIFVYYREEKMPMEELSRLKGIEGVVSANDVNQIAMIACRHEKLRN